MLLETIGLKLFDQQHIHFTYVIFVDLCGNYNATNKGVKENPLVRHPPIIIVKQLFVFVVLTFVSVKDMPSTKKFHYYTNQLSNIVK